MKRSDRIRLPGRQLLLLCLLVLTLGTAQGQPYCDDADPQPNKDYWTIKSKCTLVVRTTPHSTTVSVQFKGPSFAANDPNPSCGAIAPVVCRRFCGDLPKGKKFGQILTAGFSPNTDEHMDKYETYDNKDPVSVCYLFRNWANGPSGGRGGEERLFAFEVGYKAFPPTTTASVVPAPNAAGWNNSDVSVKFHAVDAAPESRGVREIRYSASGPQIISPQVVAGDATAFRLDQEGSTAVTFFAISNSDDAESPQNLIVRIDKTPPEISNAFDATTHDLVMQSYDALSGVAAPPKLLNATSDHILFGTRERRTYEVFDVAGNRLRVEETVEKTKRSVSATVTSLQYNDAASITVPSNRQKFEWRLGNGATLVQLEEELDSEANGVKRSIRAVFRAEKASTEIEDVTAHAHTTKPGLSLFEVHSRSGAVEMKN